MATYRIGIGSDFKLDGGIGIGTDTAPSGRGDLRVEGTIKTTDLDVTGVSTFTRYAGFAVDNLEIGKDTSLTGEHSTQGDIVVGLNSTFTVSTGATVTVGTVESVSIGTHFSPPTGDINDRPEVPVEGTVRFNKDLNTLEFYNGVDWRQFTVSGASGRGIWGGGATPTYQTMQDFITISSLGNAQYFGELTVARGFLRAVASSVRGVTGGGEGSPARTDTMEYFTIQSSGQASDFGNLTAARGMLGSTSSSTRGVWGGGEENSPTGNVNKIEYIEISTIGNAVDFGDLTVTRKQPHSGLVNSPTRGTFAGGASIDSVIDVINIAAKGNSTKFGDLSEARKGLAGCSNSTRGVFICGEAKAGPVTNTLDYITIASDGNANEFGDAMSSRYIINGGVSNGTRGVWSGGATALNLIEYINFSTLGDSMDFGDLALGRRGASGCSNSHGGLGGY